MSTLESQCIRHEPCPKCDSRDNLGRYSDGHGYCFGCGYYEHGEHETLPSTKSEQGGKANKLVRGEVRALGKRGITEETCAFFRYEVGELNGKTVQIANYIRDGAIVAQKIRYPNKDFKFLGDAKHSGLFGQHLWRDGGRKLVVTEGEIDALTVSQLQSNKWPVVSVPNGAQGAAKSIQKELEWVEKFDEVVFMFDMDEPGQKAARECAQLLTPGKAKIAALPRKDPNELLQNHEGAQVIKAMWDAKTFRPDGVVAGSDTWDMVANENYVESVTYPWAGMNSLTRGLRKGELVTLTAGSGIGKSLVCREIAHHLIKNDKKVGYIALEENVRRTALGFMSVEMNKPLHLLPKLPDTADMRAAWEATVGSGKVFLYDHFGSMESDNLISRIRYLVRGCGCDWIVLDHLSIVVSGIDDGDERKTIDVVMTKLRSLVEETGAGMLLVSHLKRPPQGGRGHEDGVQTSLSHLRGSHSIAQLSDIVIGLERNQQDEEEADVTTVRVLKNRFTGETGVCGRLTYNRETGRLLDDSNAFSPGSTEEEAF